jgi:uncharacterized protein DUF6615
MPSLCATFRREAGVVWNRMRTAAQLGLALSEETLTECSLYNIALAHQGTNLVIDLATKPAEAKHGADWEWWFIRGGKGVGFRVQAKRLFAAGQYSSLMKPGKNPYEQLDKLVLASEKASLEALYCFYNFAHPLGQFAGPNPCHHSYRAPSFWGCSLAFPDQVKNLKSNQLAILRPIMRPWHTLVCGQGKIDAVVGRFVREVGGRDRPASPRNLPSRVSRLISLSELRKDSPTYRGYLDDSYWQDDNDFPNSVAGIILFRDKRD